MNFDDLSDVSVGHAHDVANFDDLVSDATASDCSAISEPPPIRHVDLDAISDASQHSDEVRDHRDALVTTPDARRRTEFRSLLTGVSGFWKHKRK